MKKRYSEEQTVKILKEGEVGGITETCRRYGVNVNTFYNCSSGCKAGADIEIRAEVSAEK
jgi:transposase-like protein